jgi:hypothetical protein
MADYYPIIVRAVTNLAQNTDVARHTLYERARNALVTQLRSQKPPLSESQVIRERQSLEGAIRRVESEQTAKRENPSAIQRSYLAGLPTKSEDRATAAVKPVHTASPARYLVRPDDAASHPRAEENMEEFSRLDGGQWIGFATRSVPLHGLLKVLAIFSCLLSALPLMIGGLAVWISLKRDSDYDLRVMTLKVGIVLLALGLLMFMFEALRQRRQLRNGEINGAGVFWNPKTKERLVGQFRFNIGSGSKMPGRGAGFKHECYDLQYTRTKNRRETEIANMENPILKLIFTVKNGMTKGIFAAGSFTSRNYLRDLDLIIFTRGSITRVNGKKANPYWLCSEIGRQLKSNASGLINVQVIVDPNTKGATGSSSNVFAWAHWVHLGAKWGGPIGALVGAGVQAIEELEQRHQFTNYKVEVQKLLDGLQKVVEEFGWSANIRDGAVSNEV